MCSMHTRCLLDPPRLVAIVSGGVMFRNNAKTVAFRELVYACGGTFTENPAGSFKESGTSVNTVLVTMNKKVL